jgi:hypothetical protein
MSNVVALRPADFPPRSYALPEYTPLVTLFRNEPAMLPFIRFLFDDYGIFNLADWDAATPRLIDRFELSPQLSEQFKQQVGRPARRAGIGPAPVLPLLAHAMP